MFDLQFGVLALLAQKTQLSIIFMNSGKCELS